MRCKLHEDVNQNNTRKADKMNPFFLNLDFGTRLDYIPVKTVTVYAYLYALEALRNALYKFKTYLLTYL